MDAANYNIHVLKALHGDAFILRCSKGNNTGIVIVDGGPRRNSRRIVDEFDKLGTIDLMVLTHFDLDHIGGILAYIAKHKNDRPFPVKEIWCNCAYELPVTSTPNISYKDAKKLADLLIEINGGLKSNGYPEVNWQTFICAGQEIKRPFADFLILSPENSVKTLSDNLYRKSVANISMSHKRQKEALQKTLEELSANSKAEPSETDISELVNWSSIAFFVNCDNLKALMLGDSFPATVIKSLMGFNYSAYNHLKTDLCKVSHHGSRNNISNEMLDMIDCSQYVFSTNGGLGTACHPDRETIGNILYHERRDHNKEVNLFFNYSRDVMENNGYKILNSGEEEIANFKVKYDVEYL